MELVIRTVDKDPTDITASQRGDVVCSMPDGWEWSPLERANPAWLIVTCDLTDIEVQALQETARPDEPAYRRRLGVNPTGLVAGDTLTRAQLMGRIF